MSSGLREDHRQQPAQAGRARHRDARHGNMAARRRLQTIGTDACVKFTASQKSANLELRLWNSKGSTWPALPESTARSQVASRFVVAKAGQPRNNWPVFFQTGVRQRLFSPARRVPESENC